MVLAGSKSTTLGLYTFLETLISRHFLTHQSSMVFYCRDDTVLKFKNIKSKIRKYAIPTDLHNTSHLQRCSRTESSVDLRISHRPDRRPRCTGASSFPERTGNRSFPAIWRSTGYRKGLSASATLFLHAEEWV